MNSKSIKADRRLRTRKGMTLVEVLVAMTLLTLIVLVFTPLFMNYYRNIRTAGDLTQKTYERTSLMERLVANPYKNDTGYETHVTKGNLPLKLTAGATTVDFSADIEGQLVSESLNDDGSYVSFYSPNTSDTMVCFPANLTDDFLTKDITVVPKGFEFAAAAANKNSAGAHFEVYNTSSTGGRVKVSTAYYDIRYDSDGEGVAIFTFKGGNNVISFENSPLYIQYYTAAASMYKEVKVEITAPEIILVGEKASDNNYYYYATSGVDLKTGKMDIVAKQMNKDKDGNDVGLVSAMNDVEWVAKGRGDDGNGGVNQYGYYVMGGDAGQVRRFWRNETTGNYYWGGDVLGNYDKYYYITGDNSKDSKSYENITQEKTTQAVFKNIFRSNQDKMDFNGVTDANALTESNKFTLGFSYETITSNYYTANVSYDSTQKSEYFTTIGRVLAYKTKDGKTEVRYAGHTDEIEDKNWNNDLHTWLNSGSGYGTNLDIDGYKAATNYEYNGKGGSYDDPSLITITSVGAVQINKSNSNYSESTQNSIFGTQLYPTQSYTLYCGYIPAVIDIWGWKTANNVFGIFFNQNWSRWLHAGTLGVATDGNSWYPTGKFGDTKTTATTSDTTANTLSKSIFGNNPSWSSLLNYGSDASLYPFGETSATHQEPVYDGYDIKYEHQIQIQAEVDNWGWKTYTKWFTVSSGSTNSSNRFGITGKDLSGSSTNVNKKIRSAIILQSQIKVNGVWVDDGNKDNIVIQDLNSTEIKIVEGNSYDNNSMLHIADNYTYKYREPHIKEYKTITDWSANSSRYYGPTGSGGNYVSSPSDVNNATLTNRSFVGTALPEQGNDYYISSGKEVDVTVGYLSQPYAIAVNKPSAPDISGLSGSDYYFKKYGDASGSKYDHSFFNAGLRDFITMLDVKSYHDDITGNNLSLAVGYTLSLVTNDYDYMTRLGHVMNTGIVYIRATGDGTESDTTGDLTSGKGWSLKKETNVFHQFYGIDQYLGNNTSGVFGVFTKDGTSAIYGWNTKYHRAYFNLSTSDSKAPQASYSPNLTEGNTKYGVNCHPMSQTECTTVGWGNTYDFKPQAMWGTANGTVLSWYYDYETPANSKITSVMKEFESYMWCDRLGVKPSTSDEYAKEYYDFTTVNKGNYGSYGFVSVLKSVNDICFSDDVWVAVGDQSGKAPNVYSAPNSYNRLAATGNAGSYVNVKFYDDALGYSRWIHVKIANETNVNIRSVVNCQGIWYLMGYVDTNGNCQNDAGERCVMYYSTNPANGFMRCKTRMTLDGTYTGAGYDQETYALYFDSNGDLLQLKLDGVNKMACQSS